MRAELSPDYARNYLAIHLDTVEGKRANSMRAVWQNRLNPLAPETRVTVQKLSNYWGEHRAEYIQLGLAVAKFRESESLGIYLPDDWMPQSYFSRVPIPVDRVMGASDLVEELPPAGIKVFFDRPPDSMYDLFPLPEPADVK